MRRDAKALSCARRYVWRWAWRRQTSVPDGTEFTGPMGCTVTSHDIILPFGDGWEAMHRRYRAQRIGRPQRVRYSSLEDVIRRFAANKKPGG